MCSAEEARRARRLRLEAQGDSAAARLYRDLVKTGLLAPDTAQDYRRRARDCGRLCAEKIAEARALELQAQRATTLVEITESGMAVAR